MEIFISGINNGEEINVLKYINDFGLRAYLSIINVYYSGKKKKIVIEIVKNDNIEKIKEILSKFFENSKFIISVPKSDKKFIAK